MTRKKIGLVFIFVAGAILTLSGVLVLAIHVFLGDSSANISLEKEIVERLDNYEVKSIDKETRKLLEEASVKFAKNLFLVLRYRLALANESYREADQMFWDILGASRKPGQSKRPNFDGNIVLYDKYLGQLDKIVLEKSGQEDLLWQIWNNKGNAEVYEIFLNSLLREDQKKLQRLAKNALDYYVKALDYCGKDKECANFVSQNIDWLTRMPPKKTGKEGESEVSGGGLGNLFETSQEGKEGEGSQDDKNKSQIFLPGVTPGQSVKGAH